MSVNSDGMVTSDHLVWLRERTVKGTCRQIHMIRREESIKDRMRLGCGKSVGAVEDRVGWRGIVKMSVLIHL